MGITGINERPIPNTQVFAQVTLNDTTPVTITVEPEVASVHLRSDADFSIRKSALADTYSATTQSEKLATVTDKSFQVLGSTTDQTLYLTKNWMGEAETTADQYNQIQWGFFTGVTVPDDADELVNNLVEEKSSNFTPTSITFAHIASGYKSAIIVPEDATQIQYLKERPLGTTIYDADDATGDFTYNSTTVTVGGLDWTVIYSTVTHTEAVSGKTIDITYVT